MKLKGQSLFDFLSWWKNTLLSCLPQGISNGVTRYSNKFELIIAQHGETVFIQDSRGRIINQLSSNTDEVVPDESLVDISMLNVSDSEPQVDDGTIVFIDKTRVQNRDSGEVDIDLSEFAVDNIDKTAQIFDISTRITDQPVDLMTENTEVYLRQSSDDTVYDQDDNTRLFINDGGNIRSVDPQALNDNQGRGDEASKPVDSESSYQRVAYLLGKYQKNRKCLYLIPDDKVFHLSLSYPVEASENVDNVLRHDLEKHVPLNFDEIYYFYALNINRADSKVDVDVVIVKTSELDLLDQSLKSYLNKGLVCSTQNLFQKYGGKINIKKPLDADGKTSIFKFNNLIKGLNLILLLALLWLPYQLYQQYFSSLPEYSEADLSRVTHIVSSLKSIQTENKYRAELIADINSQPRVVDILSTLSEVIEPQAWLNSFSIKGDEIRLKGEAESATVVSDNLNKSGLFKSIKFVSSIIKNTKNDKETFELLLKVKPDA